VIRDRDLIDNDETDTTELRSARPCVICKAPTVSVVFGYGTIRGYSPCCSGH